jgi:hypothetical protein
MAWAGPSTPAEPAGIWLVIEKTQFGENEKRGAYRNPASFPLALLMLRRFKNPLKMSQKQTAANLSMVSNGACPFR